MQRVDMQRVDIQREERREEICREKICAESRLTYSHEYFSKVQCIPDIALLVGTESQMVQ